MDELDELYGPVIPAQNGLRPWEVQESLKCYELNQASAKEISELIAWAGSSQIGLQIMQALTLLWIVNQDGDLIFALEETVAQEGTLRRPRMRGTPLNASVKPLGHPLLVNGGGARIGGELYVDESAESDDLTWVSNNKSGRYGVHDTRKSEHLENAANLLRRHQLQIETDFKPAG